MEASTDSSMIKVNFRTLHVSVSRLFHQMKPAFLGILLLLLQSLEVSSHHSHKYWILKPNVLVVDVDLTRSTQIKIQLRCGDDFEGQEISWKNEGAVIHEQRGNQIEVIVEEVIGGNYTCHNKGGTLLNHTLVLVQVQNELRQRRILEGVNDKDYIRCISRNYSGNFKCSWKWSKVRKGSIVLITAARFSNASSISCDLNSEQSGIVCVDRSHCPFVEEVDAIGLTVYVRHQYRLEKYFRQFYISETVKPDRIDVEKINNNAFQWKYPGTWNGPNSYFPLTFQVKVIPYKEHCDYNAEPRLIKENLMEKQYFLVNDTKKLAVCVRAQDTLTKSMWSDWTKTQNYVEKMARKKMRKAKKKQRKMQL